MSRVLAAADIGSNTVHLLIAECDGRKLARLENRSEWVSLGEIVAREGCVPESDLGGLIDALKNFKRLAKAKGAEYLYLFGTAAVRAASNHEAIIREVRTQTDLVLDLISPRREAELSVEGALIDAPADFDLLLEVGGGSAQIARLEDGKVADCDSIAIGTGKIIADAGLRYPAPEAAQKAAKRIIRERLDDVRMPITPLPRKVVASGGVARGLWRALHPDGDPSIHRNELDYVAWASARLSSQRTATRFNVKNKRAATLLPGALSYSGLMDLFEVEEMFVSEYGVREGAILQISKGSIQGCLV